MESLDLIKTAANFINTTSRHIFLTGKAGTGKTTFLRDLAKHTHKEFLIVAPTGIAALNAGGVTIHSQFQLPLGTFLPDRTPGSEFSQDNQIYTQYTLTRKHPISSIRKQVLRSIELLIIDEVSMLRADVLDAVDYRMRAVRGNFSRSFGGVQVLMIGDLYQLPPIVKDYEWRYLKQFYHNAFFFEAKALQTEGFIQIELQKIFRQSNPIFIDLLNNLRNNQVTESDITLLNTYYKPLATFEQDVITITTHNNRADAMNKESLEVLPTRSFFYDAIIDGDFPENIYPILKRMELREGAQVMFVKNDTSQDSRYFNGKLARVVALDKEQITVEMGDSKEQYNLKRVEWENKRYKMNSSTRELDEEVIGTFLQYPIKLAWAVTVHKSQGLTFDKAIIDVGNAFAPGQVYVALSRLRSLDGLILRTKITPAVISNDADVVSFSKEKAASEELQRMLEEGQSLYIEQLIHSVFDFSIELKEIEFRYKKHETENQFQSDEMKHPLRLLQEAFTKEVDNTQKFRHQLMVLLSNRDIDMLCERLKKGSDYYANMVGESNALLLKHIWQIKKLGKGKAYLNELEEIDQILVKKLLSLRRAVSLIESVLRDEPIAILDAVAFKEERERRSNIAIEYANTHPLKKSSRRPQTQLKSTQSGKSKGATVLLTVELFQKKMTISQIAERRGLVISTIESHIAKAIEMDMIQLDEIMSQGDIDTLTKVWDEFPNATSREIYISLANAFSYGQVKAAKAHIDKNRG